MWRFETPYILAALLRRSGDFETCEDAVQEALLAAAAQWPSQGTPDNPRAWLIRVASRKLIDLQRSHAARTQREIDAAVQAPADTRNVESADSAALRHGGDDTLQMLLLCAHPALSEASQLALTLRAVAGLSIAQIAAGFLVPEATMAQRISRAKATLRTAGARFQPPTWDGLPGRLRVVRHVLYLAFNEGYTTSSGTILVDTGLAREAIRLAERLHRSVPDDTETSGLLALMLLTHARTSARIGADGDLVPLAEQDRTRWDRDMIARGTALIEEALPAGDVGPFQLQAAIAAVHGEAATSAATDWMQITILYRMLDHCAPSPTVTLNLAIAVGMAHGPAAGLDALAPLLERSDQQRNHRVHAARAHLLELAGDTVAAKDAFDLAARLTSSIPEQRYLNRKAGRLRPLPGGPALPSDA
ncbi:sigma factor-like helix-turn-helix DNA-binding protein [Arthrobacter monumenti]